MENLLEQLYLLKRDKRGDYERPHKPALLLAVFDLFERGLFKNGQITFTDELRKSFNQIFDVVKKEDSKPTIQNPFFYLSGESFWNLLDENGQELYVSGNVSRAPTLTKLKSSRVELSEEFKTLLR